MHIQDIHSPLLPKNAPLGLPSRPFLLLARRSLRLRLHLVALGLRALRAPRARGGVRHLRARRFAANHRRARAGGDEGEPPPTPARIRIHSGGNASSSFSGVNIPRSSISVANDASNASRSFAAALILAMSPASSVPIWISLTTAATRNILTTRKTRPPPRGPPRTRARSRRARLRSNR